MNIFEKILYALQVEMEEPKAFGWFHLLWIGLVIIAITILYKTKNKYSSSHTTLFCCTPTGPHFHEVERLKDLYGYPDSKLKEYNVLKHPNISSEIISDT